MITALLLLVTAVTAQDDKDRLELAQQQLARLRARVVKLPPAPEPDFRVVPTPLVGALELATELAEFARLNEDLPLAAEAWRLAAVVRRSQGDVVRAVLALEKAADGETNPTRAAGDRGLAAEIRLAFGAASESGGALEALAKEAPGHDDAPKWKRLAREAEATAVAQERKLQAIATAAAGNGRGTRSSYLEQIFAYRNPLHQRSGAILAQLILRMKDAPPEQKLGYLERMVFYRPEEAGWLNAVRQALEVLAREGHYEKAFFCAAMMLDRSEILAPGESSKIGKVRDELRTRLSRIAARRLDVKPPTKDLRLAHFYRTARGGEAAEVIQELGDGLLADYPTCSEVPELRMLCAEVLAKEIPEAALAHWKSVAENFTSFDRAREAFTSAAELLVETEGPEAADDWLKSLQPRYEDVDDRARLALLRAGFLDDAERWEDAQALLQGVSPKDPFIKREIEARLAALAKKLE